MSVSPTGIPRSAKAMERFTARYVVEDLGYATPCWRWTGTLTSMGYASFNADGLQCRAHRYSYAAFNGEIPEGQSIDHLCMNKACVNPAHLEVVSLAENTRRFQAARTHCQRGHPWIESNFIYEGERRFCRICRVTSRAASRAKRGTARGCKHRLAA